MISPRDLITIIFLTLILIIIGTIGLTDGIKRKDWFNLIGGIICLLMSFYLIWGIFLVTENI